MQLVLTNPASRLQPVHIRHLDIHQYGVEGLCALQHSLNAQPPPLGQRHFGPLEL
ncbi:hypothetical protein D3C81_2212920 [compost metagenome]